MKQYYARRADEYEAIYHKPERQSNLRLLESRIAEVFAGRKVLEIACGTGYWTQFASRSALSITATDINPEVIAVAETKQYGVAPTFLIADAYRPQEIAGDFDALLCAFWWSHVPKQQLAEFLKPLSQKLPTGSLMVFLDNRYVEGSSTPIAHTDESGNTFQDRALKDGTTHRVLKNFPRSEEIKIALARFADDIEITELEYYWLAKCRSTGK
ncbi:MAG: methyltransferase domain-containing protein [bacterium]|nr:methyltransferase domain-containing protein [bacterium]